jgi:hypothetical protein
MSLPGLIAQPVLQTAGSILNPIESIIGIFNTNPYFIGLMMLFLNLGGRFLMLEVSKEQEKFFQNPWVRRFLIFIVLFVATRSIVTAFWLSLVAILILGYLFNENSSMCLFNYGRAGSKCGKKEGPETSPGLTPDEQEILRRLSEKHMRYSRPSSDEKKSDEEDDADVNEIYIANLELLNKH